MTPSNPTMKRAHVGDAVMDASLLGDGRGYVEIERGGKLAQAVFTVTRADAQLAANFWQALADDLMHGPQL